jgi:PEP-CTERM motif
MTTKQSILIALAALATSQFATAAGVIYVSDINGAGVGTYDSSTGAYLGLLVATQPGHADVSAVATASNGDLYLAEWTTSNTSTIYRYNTAGTLLSTLGNTSDLILDMSVGPDGNLYTIGQTSSSSGTAVHVFSGTTGALLSTPITNTSAPDSIEIAPNGNILVGYQGSLFVYNSSGALLSAISIPELSFGMIVAPNGDVYVSGAGSTYGSPSSIYRCTGCQTGTGSFTLFGTDPTGGTMYDLAFAPGNQLLVASRFANDILKFDATSGAYLGILASTQPQQTGPARIALGASATPEPATLLIVGSGLLALAALRKPRPI